MVEALSPNGHPSVTHRTAHDPVEKLAVRFANWTASAMPPNVHEVELLQGSPAGTEDALAALPGSLEHDFRPVNIVPSPATPAMLQNSVMPSACPPTQLKIFTALTCLAFIGAAVAQNCDRPVPPPAWPGSRHRCRRLQYASTSGAALCGRHRGSPPLPAAKRYRPNRSFDPMCGARRQLRTHG